LNNFNDTYIRLDNNYDSLDFKKQGEFSSVIKNLDVCKGSIKEDSNLRIFFYCNSDDMTIFKVSINHTESIEYKLVCQIFNFL
jgi:hypothetical protein